MSPVFSRLDSTCTLYNSVWLRSSEGGSSFSLLTTTLNLTVPFRFQALCQTATVISSEWIDSPIMRFVNSSSGRSMRMMLCSFRNHSSLLVIFPGSTAQCFSEEHFMTGGQKYVLADCGRSSSVNNYAIAQKSVCARPRVVRCATTITSALVRKTKRV
jgi:hypothetical protein